MGSEVGRIGASDPENDDLTYSISGGSAQKWLDINPTTGQISVIDPSPLLSLPPGTTDFTLDVSVHDEHGKSDSATLKVHVLDVQVAPIAIRCGDSIAAPGELCYPTLNYELNTKASGFRPQSSVAADVNGDGLLDIITSGDDVLVSLGSEQEVFSPPIPYLADGDENAGLVFGDVNNDGIGDIVRLVRGSSRISVFVGDSTGAFAAPIHSFIDITWLPPNGQNLTLGLVDHNSTESLIWLQPQQGKEQVSRL